MEIGEEFRIFRLGLWGIRILGLGWVIVVFDGLFVFAVKFGVVLVQKV